MDWYNWLSNSTLESPLVYEYGLAFTRNELQEEDVPHLNHELLQSMGISVAKHRIEILKLAKKECARNPAGLSSKLLLAIRKTRKCFAKGISRWVFHDHDDADGAAALPELRPCHAQWSGALSKKHSTRLMDHERLMLAKRSSSNSKLCGGHEQEGFMMMRNPNRRSPRASGPLLDGRMIMEDRMVGRSPNNTMISSPLHHHGSGGVVTGGTARSRRSPNNKKISAGQQQKLINGRLSSPNHGLQVDDDEERADPDGEGDFDSIWATLFQEMKPT